MVTIRPSPRKVETILTGKRLASLRALYGWTQAELADRVGWRDRWDAPNRSRVAQLETGRCQFRDVEQRELFAKAFHITLDDLNRVLRGDLDVVAAAAVGAKNIEAGPSC